MVVVIGTDCVFLNGTKVAELGGQFYISHRDAKRHYYVMGGGYPISNEILKELNSKRPEIKMVKIIEKGAKEIAVYTCPIQEYRDAVMIEVGGFEQQRCVPLKKMKKEQVYPL